MMAVPGRSYISRLSGCQAHVYTSYVIRGSDQFTLSRPRIPGTCRRAGDDVYTPTLTLSVPELATASPY